MRKISLIIFGVVFASLFKSNVLAVSGDCGWCGRQCVHLKSDMRCIMISAPSGMECVAVGEKCVMRSNRVLPSLRPTPTVREIPTVAPENAKCASFSDDFSDKKLDKGKWLTSSSRAGKAEIVNNELNLVMGAGSSVAWNNVYTKNSQISGDFVAEVTLKSIKTTDNKSQSVSDIRFVGVNMPTYRGFRIFRGNNEPNIVSSYFFNDGEPEVSVHKEIGLTNDRPVRVKMERVGNTVNLYYDLMDGNGYILLMTTDKAYMGSGHIELLNDSYGPDFPGVTGVFDDFILTCGKVLRKVNKVDVNNDGKIDLVDFDMWKRVYIENRNTPETDFDGNGKTNLADFKIWKQFYLSN